MYSVRVVNVMCVSISENVLKRFSKFTHGCKHTNPRTEVRMTLVVSKFQARVAMGDDVGLV